MNEEYRSLLKLRDRIDVLNDKITDWIEHEDDRAILEVLSEIQGDLARG